MQRRQEEGDTEADENRESSKRDWGEAFLAIAFGSAEWVTWTESYRQTDNQTDCASHVFVF